MASGVYRVKTQESWRDVPQAHRPESRVSTRMGTCVYEVDTWYKDKIAAMVVEIWHWVPVY